MRIDGRLDYEAFLIDPKEPCVKLAEHALKEIGRQPMQAVSNGGLDANRLNAHGNPVRHYGDPDPGLARFGLDQTGAIKQFLG